MLQAYKYKTDRAFSDCRGQWYRAPAGTQSDFISKLTVSCTVAEPISAAEGLAHCAASF